MLMGQPATSSVTLPDSSWRANQNYLSSANNMMRTITSIRIAALAMCLTVSAYSEIEITLKNSFIEEFKNRATITATYASVSKTANLAVTAPVLVSVALNPATVADGASSTGNSRSGPILWQGRPEGRPLRLNGRAVTAG